MQTTKWHSSNRGISYTGLCYLLRVLVLNYFFFIHSFMRWEHSRHWEICFQWDTAVAFFLVKMKRSDESNKNWNVVTFQWHKQNSNELIFFSRFVHVVILKQTYKGKMIQGNIVSTHKAPHIHTHTTKNMFMQKCPNRII